MKAIINDHQSDLRQMSDDIVTAAQIAGVAYDREKINTVLEAYKAFYSRTAVTFVTSTKPVEKRGLSIRYVELRTQPDPYGIALERGLLIPQKHPIYEVIPELQERLPMLGYGVDMDASYGLTKIWPFVIPQPVEKAYELTTLPDSLRKHASFFSQHRFNIFSLFALDFRNKTANLYFMVKSPGHLTGEKIGQWIAQLGLPVPDQEILEYCTRAVTIYFTFGWERTGVERVCFGMSAHQPQQVPTHLHSLLSQYVEQVPCLSAQRKFIFSYATSRQGDFIKIENDYSGTMIDMMEQGAQNVPDFFEEPRRESSETNKESGREWEPGVYELFEQLVAKVPDNFRPMVKPLLLDTAGKKCLERNAGYINRSDLITALFDITPEPFKAEARRNLQDLGIDVERYIELKKIRDQYKLSWETFGKAFHPGNIHFAMYLTDRCNQRCLHCAADSRVHRPELSKERWFDIIENLETSLRSQGRHGVYIWFGGEPTCREDLRDIIRYCGDREYYQAIITNGILFDSDLTRYCADHGMSHVFVSIDSADPQKSDKIRGTAGSLAFAQRAIKNALDYGLFVCCSTTVMKQNIDELDAIKSLAESWGAMPYFRAVVKQKKAAENWQEIGLDHQDYKYFYEFKYKHAIEAIRSGKAGTLPIYSIYEMVPFMECPGSDSELTALEWGVGCQACRTMAGIDINGDVFPCGYPSQLLLGNVLQERFLDIMNSQRFKDIRDRKRSGKCASCHHLSLCGGGCRVHAESETDDFFASFSYCWHENDHTHDFQEGYEKRREPGVQGFGSGPG